MEIARDMPTDVTEAVAKVVREGRQYGVQVLISSASGSLHPIASVGIAPSSPSVDPIPGPDAKQWIYPAGDGYVISLCGAWLPGSYADLATARAAFDYDDATLHLAAGDGTVPITMQRLRSTIKPADPR